MFKEGVEPSWEDKANSKGGKWTCVVPKLKIKDLDEFWLNVALACIGEQFQIGDDISGVVVSIRKGQDRISLWTTLADDENRCKTTGRDLKKFLQTNDKLSFVAHADSAVKKSSFTNDKYFV